uniref:Uncharacterized protein n=1 Tax=Glossina morsitans morsitans TaxID=37546 RepID=A0A1B0G2I9_GLOMM
MPCGPMTLMPIHVCHHFRRLQVHLSDLRVQAVQASHRSRNRLRRLVQHNLKIDREVLGSLYYLVPLSYPEYHQFRLNLLSLRRHGLLCDRGTLDFLRNLFHLQVLTHPYSLDCLYRLEVRTTLSTHQVFQEGLHHLALQENQLLQQHRILHDHQDSLDNQCSPFRQYPRVRLALQKNQPGKPCSPTSPISPGKPSSPKSPRCPFKPANPCNPFRPGTPVSPLNPGKPSEPIPSSPLAPCIPF